GSGTERPTGRATRRPARLACGTGPTRQGIPPDMTDHHATSAHSTALSAARRDRELAALRERTDPVDRVVIGGGITGVGIALDATTRGRDSALLAAHDLPFGTSRWTTKLAHCAVRYLASGH